MNKLNLTDNDSFIKIKVNRENPKSKFIELELNNIIGEDVANAIINLAGIMGKETGDKPEDILLDIITNVLRVPMVQQQQQ